MLKICPICNQEFEGHGNRKFCSETCKDTDELLNRTKPEPEILFEERPRRESELDAKNAKARSKGLTYGQMEAMKYASEHRVEV
ncbi:DNA gyrase inhibitor YacG [Aminipila butyrica]|uniref:DNA gyrase inhibitor YacG n=1 Tax=Aminipila butyrica TaxID=433296 RepID=A0A858BQY8_9FIRM|nr:DNA gyrase inhibitor YacG [Aminipila butyrica]QIB68253.1 DNA gyrase inhibitor YacG [Aminipila butyrica]